MCLRYDWSTIIFIWHLLIQSIDMIKTFKIQSTLRPKLWGCVFYCPRKDLVNVCPLTYHDQNYPIYKSGLRTKSKLRILITDPDYADPRLRIWDYRSRTMDPDYASGLRIRIRITDRDNFGNYRLKNDQNLPHFYTDNFSRDDRTNDSSPGILDKMYFEWSVIAEYL